MHAKLKSYLYHELAFDHLFFANKLVGLDILYPIIVTKLINMYSDMGTWIKSILRKSNKKPEFTESSMINRHIRRSKRKKFFYYFIFCKIWLKITIPISNIRPKITWYSDIKNQSLTRIGSEHVILEKSSPIN